MCIDVLPMYTSVHLMNGSCPWSKKKKSTFDPLKLELHMVVNPHLGPGNLTGVI